MPPVVRTPTYLVANRSVLITVSGTPHLDFSTVALLFTNATYTVLSSEFLATSLSHFYALWLCHGESCLDAAEGPTAWSSPGKHIPKTGAYGGALTGRMSHNDTP